MRKKKINLGDWGFSFARPGQKKNRGLRFRHITTGFSKKELPETSPAPTTGTSGFPKRCFPHLKTRLTCAYNPIPPSGLKHPTTMVKSRGSHVCSIYGWFSLIFTHLPIKTWWFSTAKWNSSTPSGAYIPWVLRSLVDAGRTCAVNFPRSFEAVEDV